MEDETRILAVPNPKRVNVPPGELVQVEEQDGSKATYRVVRHVKWQRVGAVWIDYLEVRLETPGNA